MPGRGRLLFAVSFLMFAGACRDATEPPTSPLSRTISESRRSDQGMEVLSGAVVHRTLDAVRAARAASRRTSPSVELTYGGGAGGIGVETAPKIYLVVWGSQWNGNDPSGEVAILNSFYSGIGTSSWLNTVTEYCEGVAKGTVFCNGAGTAAGNQSGMLAGVWYDNASAAPSRPTQANIASEAVRAAQHFGNTNAASNAGVQYVVATASRNSSRGFGTQYCAYHSSATSTSLGNVAYTNLPYITDAGASCGANFNGLGANAGITIVSGHEAAESITDPFPNTGWLDSSGSEIGDKCVWISTGTAGASQNVTISTGTFAVQSLWSNAASTDKGGCVVSF